MATDGGVTVRMAMTTQRNTTVLCAHTLDPPSHPLQEEGVLQFYYIFYAFYFYLLHCRVEEIHGHPMSCTVTRL
jgi:hypothetical protein